MPAGRDVALELTVSDTNHFRYRLILSTAIKRAAAAAAAGGGGSSRKRNPGNPLHFQLPLRMAKTKWTNVVVDVVALTQATFGDVHGAKFRCVDNVAITANCRLRNVFSALENPVAVPSAVPAHLELRLANGRPPRTVFVDGEGNGKQNSGGGGGDDNGLLSPTAPSPATDRERKLFSSFPTAPSARSTTAAATSSSSSSARTPARTPRLPLPSPVPTLVHAPGAAAAAAMVSPSLPSPPASVRLAFGTRVGRGINVVDSAAGASPPRSAKAIRPRSSKKKQELQRQMNRRALSSRSPARGNVEHEKKATSNYWDELPRRRFPKSTDENDEFMAAEAASPTHPHRIPSAMDRYGEGSPLSPPTNIAVVRDAMPSPSLGSEAERLSFAVQAIGGPSVSASPAAVEAVATPVREEEEVPQDHEPEATPPREYEDMGEDGLGDVYDEYDEYDEVTEEGEDDDGHRHAFVEEGDFDEMCADEEDVKEAMDALRERVFVEDAAAVVVVEEEEEDEPFAGSYNEAVEGSALRQTEDDVGYDDMANGDGDGYEEDVEAAAYVDDEDAENDEEAAARIADLYAQLESKRRQIAQMEAEFSDAETNEREESHGMPGYGDDVDEEETARPPLEEDMCVGDVSDDMVNMGGMGEGDFITSAAQADEDAEDDEELIFDPILDCYYSPRTNTYFERQ